MSEKNFKEKLAEKQSLFKGIACAVGGLAVIVGGLFYLLVTDLYLLNSSQWLFYGAVCAFGSGIACLLSEGLRHKKNWFYVVKGIAIVVTILFIVVIFAYKNQCDIQAIVFGKKYTTAKANAILLTTTLVSVISGFLGLLFQTGGIVLNLVYGVDD